MSRFRYDNIGYFLDGEPAPEAAAVRLAILTHNGTHDIEVLGYTNKPRTNGGPARGPSIPVDTTLRSTWKTFVATVERLRQRPGVRFLGEIDHEVGTPISATDWIYTKTPRGLVIELMSYRPGLPYESTTDKRVVLPPWLRNEPSKAP